MKYKSKQALTFETICIKNQYQKKAAIIVSKFLKDK